MAERPAAARFELPPHVADPPRRRRYLPVLLPPGSVEEARFVQAALWALAELPTIRPKPAAERLARLLAPSLALASLRSAEARAEIARTVVEWAGPGLAAARGAILGDKATGAGRGSARAPPHDAGGEEGAGRSQGVQAGLGRGASPAANAVGDAVEGATAGIGDRPAMPSGCVRGASAATQARSTGELASGLAPALVPEASPPASSAPAPSPSAAHATPLHHNHHPTSYVLSSLSSLTSSLVGRRGPEHGAAASASASGLAALPGRPPHPPAHAAAPFPAPRRSSHASPPPFEVVLTLADHPLLAPTMRSKTVPHLLAMAVAATLSSPRRACDDRLVAARWVAAERARALEAGDRERDASRVEALGVASSAPGAASSASGAAPDGGAPSSSPPLALTLLLAAPAPPSPIPLAAPALLPDPDDPPRLFVDRFEVALSAAADGELPFAAVLESLWRWHGVARDARELGREALDALSASPGGHAAAQQPPLVVGMSRSSSGQTFDGAGVFAGAAAPSTSSGGDGPSAPPTPSAAPAFPPPSPHAAFLRSSSSSTSLALAAAAGAAAPLTLPLPQTPALRAARAALRRAGRAARALPPRASERWLSQIAAAGVHLGALWPGAAVALSRELSDAAGPERLRDAAEGLLLAWETAERDLAARREPADAPGLARRAARAAVGAFAPTRGTRASAGSIFAASAAWASGLWTWRGKPKGVEEEESEVDAREERDGSAGATADGEEPGESAEASEDGEGGEGRDGAPEPDADSSAAPSKAAGLTAAAAATAASAASSLSTPVRHPAVSPPPPLSLRPGSGLGSLPPLSPRSPAEAALAGRLVEARRLAIRRALDAEATLARDAGAPVPKLQGMGVLGWPGAGPEPQPRTPSPAPTTPTTSASPSPRASPAPSSSAADAPREWLAAPETWYDVSRVLARRGLSPLDRQWVLARAGEAAGALGALRWRAERPRGAWDERRAAAALALVERHMLHAASAVSVAHSPAPAGFGEPPFDAAARECLASLALAAPSARLRARARALADALGDLPDATVAAADVARWHVQTAIFGTFKDEVTEAEDDW